MRLLLLLNAFLLFAVTASFGQTHKITLLKEHIHTAYTDRDKLAGIISLLDEYETLPKDSLGDYALQAKILAAKVKDRFAFSLAVIGQANAYLRWDNIDSARRLIEDELLKYNTHNLASKDVYFKLRRLKIDCFGNSSDYKEALPDVYSLINEAEMYRDSVVLAENYNTLGAWNYDMDFVEKSKNLYYKALSYITNSPASNPVACIIYLNLGDNYRWVGNIDSALYCINRAVAISRQIENLYYLSVGLQKLATIYIEQKQFVEAEASILRSLQLSRQIEDNEPQQEKLIVLASVYEKWGKIDSAIHVLNDGLKAERDYKQHSPHVSKAGNAKDLGKIFYYQELATCYQLKGDSKRYASMLETIISDKDAFYKANSAQAIAELETKYEVQKKETTIAQQKLALTKENYIFDGLLLFLLLAGAIVWLIFRNIRQQQKMKMQHLRDEEKRLSVQAVHNAKDQERKRIAADLHDNLGAQLGFIKRNVNFMMDRPEGFSQLDEKKYLGYVNDIAQNALVDLRETIWVLNKDEVGIQEFVDKLKSYLRQQLLDKDNIQSDFKETIDHDWRLTAGEVMHLFRIVQEVVNNVIKHAVASQINIAFISTCPGSYLLEIADNGKGFDLTNRYDGHYGLENMQQRAKEISAQFVVESKPGTGTKIVIIKE